MRFSYSCFLKINSIGIQRELFNLGYEFGGYSSNYLKEHPDYAREHGHLYCYQDKFYVVDTRPSRFHTIYDCGRNDRAFLAIAAINSYNEYMQWFRIPVYEDNSNVITYTNMQWKEKNRLLSDKINERLKSGAHPLSTAKRLKPEEILLIF